MVLAIDSPASGGVTLTQVHARFFHVDFANPANATFGVGSGHQPNTEITVDGFIDAFTSTTDLVPQQGTGIKLDTLGDKIMTPVVYQNIGGTESLWADSTVCTDTNCTGPTGVRWYQFDVTGGNFPATAAQQQTWTNTNDGFWRWMPSIAVDQSGNTVIGYSTSSTTIFPSIRYAGRLANDPPSNMGQGEAIMFAGVGFHSGYRWAIIRGQKSILLMACPSTISTNMPRAGSGTRVSASSTSRVAAQARHRQLHRALRRRLLLLLAAGQTVPICPAPTRARLECFSLLTGSFT